MKKTIKKIIKIINKAKKTLFLRLIIITGVILFLLVGVYFVYQTKKENTQIQELTKEEINEISKSIVSVNCHVDFNNDGRVNFDRELVYGSGTYIHKSLIDEEKRKKSFSRIDGYVLTNAHVSTLDSKVCGAAMFDSKEFNNKNIGLLFNDKSNYHLTDELDITLLKAEAIKIGFPVDEESLKGYLLKDYSSCPKDKMIGSKVYIFGYPTTASEFKEFYSSSIDFLFRNLIVSSGIISGMDSYENYYTDAQIDAGSSGGLAVSKIDGEICIVGIPTWISGGEYEILGMIQPFWKIKNALTASPIN